MQSRDNLPADDIVFLVSKVTLFVVTDALPALKDTLCYQWCYLLASWRVGLSGCLYCYQW